MSVVILGDTFTFPEGNAATNRVHTYSKGFALNGIEVHVICLMNEYVQATEGIHEGIHFYYPYRQKERSSYFIVRRWHKMLKYFRTFYLVKKINRKDKISFINCWTDSLSTQFFGFFLARSCRAKVINEGNEHPLRYYQDSIFRKAQGNIMLFLTLKLTDGIFCISKYLMSFYIENGFKPEKLLLVPSTVDPGRFKQVGEKPLSVNYIGYFGGLTFHRDNVDLLVRSFAEIKNDYPDLYLVLGGFCSENEMEQLKVLIDNVNSDRKIILLGYLKRQEIISYICNAKILVMVRSLDLASQASFPSKLTEYLATSRPVISANVGEIPQYLTDGVNVFLFEAGNQNACVERLKYVLDNYDIALKVGLRGGELADTIFNYEYQAVKMLEFLEHLNNQHKHD